MPLNEPTEYGILTDYDTGQPIRPATENEWLRTMDRLDNGYTGTWKDHDGRVVYVSGGPALPFEEEF